jgi:hypothetical protein
MAMSVEKLVEHFSALEDPRCSGKVDHRLIDILVIAVCAVIACAESWDDIALYGRNKLGWLQSFLSLANGIPSHDTFRRVFSRFYSSGRTVDGWSPMRHRFPASRPITPKSSNPLRLRQRSSLHRLRLQSPRRSRNRMSPVAVGASPGARKPAKGKPSW